MVFFVDCALGLLFQATVSILCETFRSCCVFQVGDWCGLEHCGQVQKTASQKDGIDGVRYPGPE